MEWVKAINDAIEFMEKNLTEKIGLVEVADSVNISAFHFHHAFTIMTGITPAEYIKLYQGFFQVSRLFSNAGAQRKPAPVYESLHRPHFHRRRLYHGI